jgi:hypothetical protein
MIVVSFSQTTNVSTLPPKLRGADTGVPEVLPRTDKFQVPGSAICTLVSEAFQVHALAVEKPKSGFF